MGSPLSAHRLGAAEHPANSWRGVAKTPFGAVGCSIQHVEWGMSVRAYACSQSSAGKRSQMKKGCCCMRFRAVIVVSAIFGVAVAGSDVAFAATAISDRTSVSAAQYGGPGIPPGGGDGPGTPPGGGTATPTTPPGGSGVTSPTSQPVAAPPVATLTPPTTGEPELPGSTPELPSGTGEPSENPDVVVPIQATGQPSLPFTGYAAIPLTIGGLLLMAGGLVLRRIPRRSAR